MSNHLRQGSYLEVSAPPLALRASEAMRVGDFKQAIDLLAHATQLPDECLFRVPGGDRCSPETAASGLGIRYNTIKTITYSTISRQRDCAAICNGVSIGVSKSGVEPTSAGRRRGHLTRPDSGGAMLGPAAAPLYARLSGAADGAPQRAASGLPLLRPPDQRSAAPTRKPPWPAGGSGSWGRRRSRTSSCRG
jgi:hypothetical protein